ncbi:MAG: signal peptidase II [Candidatus Gastranaerophilales bacterium]|nr:signal peptidase II [Candidatus Gastranaerophilales bacterium]
MNFKRLFFYIGNVIIITAIIFFGKFWIFQNVLGKYLIDPSAPISLVYVRNNGAAFNLFAGQNEFLIIFSVIIIIYFVIYISTYKLYLSDEFLMLMAFFSSGIIGNLYERVVLQYVEDYIKINLFDFPVFNLNDVLITCGALFLAIIVINDRYSEYRDIRDAAEDDLYRDL